MVPNETVKKVWNGLTLTLEAFTNKEQYPEYEILQRKTSAKTDFSRYLGENTENRENMKNSVNMTLCLKW